MTHSNQQSGYILVLTMIITSLIILIATQMFRNSSMLSSYSTIFINREKAKALAESGIAIACAQLRINAPNNDTTKKQGPTKQPPPDLHKLLLENVLPILNTWQTFSFSRATDGVEGTLHIYITCEEGKIHLNDLLTLISDPKLPQNRVTSTQKLFEKIASINNINANLYKNARNFFEQRKHIWLNDTSELLPVTGFDQFTKNTFSYWQSDKKKRTERLYLTDLFTPQSRYGKLNPWVLSPSVRMVLGITKTDSKQIQDGLKAALKNYKKTHNWAADWDTIFQPVYGISFASLGNDATFMLAQEFNPVAFSVVSYATIGSVTQGVFSLLLRKKQHDQSIVFIPIKSYMI